MWKVVVMIEFEVLSQQLLRVTKENSEKLQSWLATFRLAFESGMM
jgi:hypothetical protein